MAFRNTHFLYNAIGVTKLYALTMADITPDAFKDQLYQSTMAYWLIISSCLIILKKKVKW